MLAMVTVPRAEIDSGATVLQQALSAPWWVYAGLLVWVYASMVPLLKGARHEAFGELVVAGGVAGLLMGGQRQWQGAASISVHAVAGELSRKQA
jgi:hypothetical protein